MLTWLCVTQDLSTVRLLEFDRFSRHLPLLTLSWIDPKAEFGLSPLARLVTRTTRLDIDYVDITHCGWNDILLGPRWPTISMGTEFLEDKQSGLKWEYSVRAYYRNETRYRLENRLISKLLTRFDGKLLLSIIPPRNFSAIRDCREE